MNYREASKADISALIRLEELCFAEDRLSRRSFSHFIGAPTARVEVVEEEGQLKGYSIVLLRRGTCLSRLYSLALAPEARGQGCARQLISNAERYAIEHGCVFLRLEVRTDNQPALELYRRLGFRTFSTIRNYYADGCDALRMEKHLIRAIRPTPVNLPYYKQQTDFTCGPSALMIAMKSLDPGFDMTLSEELRIWREATTIFMQSGHGGCSPYGLAISAWKRGFRVLIHASTVDTPFIDTVRDRHKKEIMHSVHQDFMEQIDRTDITVLQENLTPDMLKQHLNNGMVAISLVSTWQLNRQKVPHWVAVTQADEHYVYVSDPEPDEEKMHTVTDNIAVPLKMENFSQMASFGKQRQRFTLLIGL
ncbi:GNAT family N-acetyltransferase/peptidase C39 family protein [Oceanospirillum sediminis]|uniref:GNAT family N-acetyltransferase/peptidase C39 family protein n=1 Tax=Oceanospirillum sediminis TaxID=2760088 RepID=A0A839IPS4_9GAMM|nr:GNAT family N-acetyltransferase/peptidase C39 family protein [Oceanospirillum sediminis]MBB1487503.1 GNAT family N-acetyltransferase/peptidase C39 family protein [Oceanospirillum sediminis]